MQPRVKQKRHHNGQWCSGILKILVILIIPLIVSCSGMPAKKHSIRALFDSGDYFGGSSRSHWSPKSYVPPEINLKSMKLSEEKAAVE